VPTAVLLEWLDEAFGYGMLAIKALAQCLSAGFRGQSVKIWEEVVAGTDDEEMPRSWVVLPEDRMMARFVGEKGFGLGRKSG